MMERFHTVIWLDQVQAKLFRLYRDRLDLERTIRAPDIHGNIHHRAGTPGPGHTETSPRFLREISVALRDTREVLIAGPAQAKFALERYLHEVAVPTKAHVVGIEALDRADLNELYRLAQRIFRKSDLMGDST